MKKKSREGDGDFTDTGRRRRKDKQRGGYEYINTILIRGMNAALMNILSILHQDNQQMGVDRAACITQ